MRQQATAHINKYVLAPLAIPEIAECSRLLVHSVMRLSSWADSFAPLWHEQLGDIWREPSTSPFTWPVLEGDDARWAVRAAIDAVVADAYGLSREQYEHVLSTFSHKSYPKAPELCLAAFDELHAIGLDAFTRKHDPYWDIPLNENLPQPVIDLPQLATEPVESQPQVDSRGQLSFLTPDHGPLFQHAANPPMAAESPTDYETDGTDAVIDADTYELIQLLLQDEGVITSANAQDLTGLSAAALRPYFQRLVSEGQATVEGQRRGTKYRWRGEDTP